MPDTKSFILSIAVLFFLQFQLGFDFFLVILGTEQEFPDRH